MIVVNSQLKHIDFIISARFYGGKDIKVGHSIFLIILKKDWALLAFFISNIIGNISLSSFISESKPWESLIFV